MEPTLQAVVKPQPAESTEWRTMRRSLARSVTILAHLSLAGGRIAVGLGFTTFSRRGSRAQVVGSECARLAEKLGPAFLKLAQVLSTRADLFPIAFLTELSRLHDRLPPIPEAWAWTIVRRESAFVGLEPPVGELVAVAGGSIASVYRFEGADSRVLALKLRRPGIAALVETDLAICRRLARVAGLVPGLRHLPVVEAMEDLCAAIWRQLDLREERLRCERLQRSLSAIPGVIVASVAAGLPSSAEMLWLEYVDRRPTECPSEEAISASVRALYHMIFVEGLVHCDLHPGNLWLRANGEAVILDYGFMSELSIESRRLFADFFFGVATNDAMRCSAIILQTARRVPAAFDSDAFNADLRELIDLSSGVSVDAFSVGRFVLSLFALQRRYGIQGTNDFTMAILALLVLEGTVKQYAPALDFQAEALPFVSLALA